MSHKRTIQSHYDRRACPKRPGFEMADWASADSQRARFEVLIRRVDLAARSLLDVGCGAGDLWGYLKDYGIAAAYSGVDLSEPVVDAARARHPDATFLQADVFAEDVFPPGSFDVVYASGIFNFALGNNEDFIAAALPQLLDLSRQTLAFNFLDLRAAPRVDYCHYYDASAVLKLVDALPVEVEVVDDYLPHDTTVLCHKT